MICDFLFAHQNCNKLAMIEDDKVITYRQLSLLSTKISNKLSNILPKKTKKHKPEIVGIFLPNSIHFVASFFAVCHSQNMIFPINTALSLGEVTNLMMQVEVSVILTSKQHQTLFENIKNQLFANDHFSSLKILYVDELTTPQITIQKHKKQKKNAPFLLLATSGTTGNAKVVTLSKQNVYTSVMGFLEKLSYDTKAKRKFLIVTPYFSAYGIMAFLFCFKMKIPFVVYKGPFFVDEICALIEKHRVTHYEGSSIFVHWLEKIRLENLTRDISSLKYVAFGGNKVYQETIKNAKQNFPFLEFFQGYGMSELSPLISKPSLKQEEKNIYQTSKLSSVGTAIKGLKIYIFDGKKLRKKPNVQGEIVVAGKNVMLGYYKNLKETVKIKIKQKIYTGDIGYFDQEGYLYIMGRKKNIINVRGLNVYPEEIEDILMRCEQVQDCLVYAENKLEKNEYVCADIVLKQPNTNLETVKQYIKENLADFKRPKKINIMTQIEKVETGKKKR